MRFEITTPEQMHELGLRLAEVLKAGDLVLLNGPLGAGKTTLTRGIGEGLGASGTVQSPTFVLARTHKTTAGPKLVHVDAYRLGSADGIADHWLTVNIDREAEDESRVVEIVGSGSRWEGVNIAPLN